MECPPALELSLESHGSRQFLFHRATGEAAWLPAEQRWELSFNTGGYGVLNGSVPVTKFLRLGLHSVIKHGRARFFVKDHCSGTVSWLEDEQKRYDNAYELMNRLSGALPMKYFILRLAWENRRVCMRLLPLVVAIGCHMLPGQQGIRWVCNRWARWEELLLDRGLKYYHFQKPARTCSAYVKKPRLADHDHRHCAVFDEYTISFSGVCVLLCWRQETHDGNASSLAAALLTELVDVYFEDAVRETTIFVDLAWSEGCASTAETETVAIIAEGPRVDLSSVRDAVAARKLLAPAARCRLLRILAEPDHVATVLMSVWSLGTSAAWLFCQLCLWSACVFERYALQKSFPKGATRNGLGTVPRLRNVAPLPQAAGPLPC